MNLLWVEDEQEKTVVFTKKLQKLGVDVYHVANVQDAIAWIQSQPLDRIIVDLNMPLGPTLAGYKDIEHNGIHVIRAIREQKRLKDEYIVCMTNFVEDARHLLRDTKVRVLPKFVYFRELREALNVA